MATRKIEIGPTGERLAANVKELRLARRMKLDDLSRRLGELGRLIPKSGLSKIESGERRVDVDDLTALAIALQVTPNRLLLTGGVEDVQIGLTEDYSTSDRAAWQWSCADDVHQVLNVLDPRSKELHDGFRNPAGRFSDGERVTVLDFKRENRPHRPPVLLSPAEWREMKPFEDRIAAIRNEVNAAGLNYRALVDDTVFEQHDDPEHDHDSFED
jgi:transcriptional regulator with XRE-family HTH domain